MKLAALIATLLHVTTCLAACTKEDRIYSNEYLNNRYLKTYTGNFGTEEKIALTMTASKNKDAIIFYPPIKKNIWMKGEIFDDGKIELHSVDNLIISIRLSGQFLERDPRGNYGNSKLACEVFSGTVSINNKTEKFLLGAEHSIGGNIQKRYSNIGTTYYEKFENQTIKFVEAISSNKREEAAKYINYPLRINSNHGEAYIKSEKEFIKEYDVIFMPKYRQAVINSIPYHMGTTKYGQAMLAQGLLFFSGNGKVSILSNWDR
jgi:hypothetical protein